MLKWLQERVNQTLGCRAEVTLWGWTDLFNFQCGKTGNSGWEIERFTLFRLGSFRKYAFVICDDAIIFYSFQPTVCSADLGILCSRLFSPTSANFISFKSELEKIDTFGTRVKQANAFRDWCLQTLKQKKQELQEKLKTNKEILRKTQMELEDKVRYWGRKYCQK